MNRGDWKKMIEATYPLKDDRREVTQHLRLALTGRLIGPDLYAICEILGQDEVNKRIINYVREHEKHMAHIAG